MSKSENSRIRILKVYEYLTMESDKEHPKGMKAILAYLAKQKIPGERKSIYKDIQILQDFGYNVIKNKYKYYATDANLNLSQIRFLMDAAQSAAFLTSKQTTEICYSIASLAGSYKAELLKEKVIGFEKVKHNNDEVFTTIENINKAINNGKKVVFDYFNVGYKLKPHFTKDKPHEENPIGLVFNNGYYYLVCYNEKHKGLVNYRVDRICKLKESVNDIVLSADAKQFVSGDIKERITAFGMWNESIKEVKILFDQDKIEDIYDKFGGKVDVVRYDDTHYYVKERVPLCDTFYGWVASYGKAMKIMAPEDVVEKFKAKIHELSELYNSESKT